MNNFKNYSDKFGKATNKFSELVKNNPDWEQYVDQSCIEPLKYLLETGSFKAVEDKFNMNYQSIRGRITRASKRIEEKNTTGLRNAQSEKAKELKELISNATVVELQELLTDTELLYAEKYMEVENFNEVARICGAEPSNVVVTLYGNKNRKGVYGKLKSSIR